jgi:hypothetical protein
MLRSFGRPACWVRESRMLERTLSGSGSLASLLVTPILELRSSLTDVGDPRSSAVQFRSARFGLSFTVEP